jgi:predicted Zn-dependent protease
MTEPDQIMLRFGDGLAANQNGDRESARSTFESLWAQVGDAGDPLHRCAIAHAMADVQDDPADELAWDLAALAAAEALSDDRLRAAGMAGTARSLQPSLRLNLADIYRRLGRPAEARHHLRAGLASVDSLGDGGYGTMIRDGLTRIQQQLDGDDSCATASRS